MHPFDDDYTTSGSIGWRLQMSERPALGLDSIHRTSVLGQADCRSCRTRLHPYGPTSGVMNRACRLRMVAALSLEHTEILVELLARRGHPTPGTFLWLQINREAESELIARHPRIAACVATRVAGRDIVTR